VQAPAQPERQVSEWQTVTPSPETGGTFVYVAGVQEGHLIQLQVRQQHKVWESVMTSQWMQVELKPKGAQR
jgi:gluconate kinase